MRAHLPHPERTPGDPTMDEDLACALRAIPLFAGLPGDEIEELTAECELCTAHPGQVVQAQDVPVRYWHVITGGHAVVQRDGTPIGLLGRATPGPSTPCSTSCAPRSPSWRSRPSRC
jgi:signal-transduction protein with cAMP-binding, CBS, and nucleotidyltransferase domain